MSALEHPHDDHHGRHEHRGGHDHVHSHVDTPSRKLAITLAMTITFCGVEAVAGFAFHSLALVADAGHMLSDAAALLLALIAQRIARRDRTRKRTFGHRRAEVLAAFVNGVALGVVAIGIVVEAARRWNAPQMIDGRGVLVTASIGLAVNVAAAVVLMGGDDHNPNTRAALAHVASDAIGSVGAIVAAILVMTLGWTRADPLISALIAVLLAYGAWRLVRRTTSVLMEGVPAAVDLKELERVIDQTPGVIDHHDLHAWSISEGFDAISVHVVLAPGSHGVQASEDVASRIRHEFGITHVTVQPERKPPSLIPASTLHRRRGEPSDGG